MVDYLLVNKNKYEPFYVIEFHRNSHYGKEKSNNNVKVTENDRLIEKILKIR